MALKMVLEGKSSHFQVGLNPEAMGRSSVVLEE